MGNLYKTISELCEKRGITGYRLCKDIGIQPSTMTDLKSGRKKGLSAEVADKIANYFGVTVGYLLGTEDKEKPAEAHSGLSADAVAVAKAYDTATERQKQMVRLTLDL